MRGSFAIAVLMLGFSVPVRAADVTPADFQPDPLSVQRYGPAYRYPQAGWIVLHVEGEPYERGYQHGRLLSNEITAYLRCSAAMRGHKAPAEAWNNTRILVNALFLRRYDREYLEEMKGIADGAAADGAKFEGRPVDLVDIVAMNAWPEIETLDSALEATPTGLEGVRFKHDQPRAMPPDKPMHCSAFAATGPATADGKIVFGHITMFGLYPSLFYNVWLDIKPAKGHRVLMQTFPGGMNSGMDYYLNDAGLLVSETTIAQTRFDVTGKALASRIRNVMQYADSIDKAVEILKDGNNGLYTNEWLLGDIKTNEIAMFELGTHKNKLYRSSKNEWFGGSEGFYWGCNNAKDLHVRLETIASTKGSPANMVWRPSDRDKMWLKLYQEHKGTIDVEFGKRAFTTPPVAAYHSLDAKFTTTDLAKGLRTWALYGPPLGKAWEPTQDERQRYPEVRAMVSNPWTVLNPNQPPKATDSHIVAVDFSNKEEQRQETADRRRRSRSTNLPAWHGTILPKTDADVWLAAAFADYERIFSEEQSLRRKDDEATQTAQRVHSEDEKNANPANDWLLQRKLQFVARREQDLEKKLASLKEGETNEAYSRLKGELEKERAKIEADLSRRKSASASNRREFSPEERRRLGLGLFTHRSSYASGVRGLNDVPLNQIKSDPSQNDWYKIASGKGVLVLHELRRLMGNDAFKDMMDAFGREHAGTAVSTADFQAHAGKSTKTPLDEFFRFWMTDLDLPVFRLEHAASKNQDGGYRVDGEIYREAGPPVMKVDVTVETAAGEVTQTVILEGPRTPFSIQTTERPKRVIVNKYGWTPRVGDASHTVQGFFANLDRTLIVYGTADDAAAQRQAAERLQRRIVESGSNITVPMKSDVEVTDDEIRKNHLVLIGRPDSNRCLERFKDSFSIKFGPRSVVVDKDGYAHAGTSVIAAAANPRNRRYSMVVLAGLSAESTWHSPEHLWRGSGNAEVLVFPANGKPRSMTLPRREVVHEFTDR